jgi:hypothetical protein
VSSYRLYCFVELQLRNTIRRPKAIASTFSQHGLGSNGLKETGCWECELIKWERELIIWECELIDWS